MPSLRLALALLTLALPTPVLAQVSSTICQPNALGTTNCPAPAPKARPMVEADPRGLDRVIRDQQRQRPRGESFIPARRTNSFGQTDPGPGGAASPRCRTDSLGNTRC